MSFSPLRVEQRKLQDRLAALERLTREQTSVPQTITVTESKFSKGLPYSGCSSGLSFCSLSTITSKADPPLRFNLKNFLLVHENMANLKNLVHFFFILHMRVVLGQPNCRGLPLELLSNDPVFNKRIYRVYNMTNCTALSFLPLFTSAVELCVNPATSRTRVDRIGRFYLRNDRDFT